MAALWRNISLESSAGMKTNEALVDGHIWKTNITLKSDNCSTN